MGNRSEKFDPRPCELPWASHQFYPWQTPNYVLEARELGQEESTFYANIPINQRKSLPLKSENVGQCVRPEHITGLSLYQRAAQEKHIKNLLARDKMTWAELVSDDPTHGDSTQVISDVSSSIVNDKNCYYTKYEYVCPKCGKQISFVDVLSIRFLEEEDKEETGISSFLELNDLPVTSCPSCNTPFAFNTFLPALHYNDALLKKTRSYKLVQALKELSQVNDSKNLECRERPMPSNVERSISFIGREIIFADHGYSYVVNNYKCTHCHKQYAIGDLTSVRKEPTFISKYERLKKVPSGNISQQRMAILEYSEKGKRFLPNIQWGITPYCMECGYNFYPYDLYEGEPIPAMIALPYDDSLFI